MEVPKAYIENTPCRSCGTTPLNLLFPVKISTRSIYNEVEGRCEKCKKPMRFLTTHDYPLSYEDQQITVPKKERKLQYLGKLLSFRNGKSYKAAKFLIDKGKATIDQLNEIFEKDYTLSDYTAWLDRRGLQGLYRVKKSSRKIILRKSLDEV